MTPVTHQFRWWPYLKAAVAVYVLAALASSLLIGIAAFLRDPAYRSDPWSILGLALLAAAPLLVIGIPMCVALSVVLQWIGDNGWSSWQINLLASLLTGFLGLLILVNFHADLITPESTVYLLPWLMFGAAFRIAVASPSRDIQRR